MRKSHIILALFISLSSVCNAISITNTAGNLENELKNNTGITALDVSGTVDVRDFKFIYESLDKLTTLDLSNASVTAFSGKIAYFGSLYNYAENSIPQLAMFGKKYTSVKLPLTVTAIGDGAMSGCNELTEIIIPSKVISIGEYAFYDCDKINTIVIPSGVTKIGDYAFAKCDNLTSATINSGASISNYCFANCEKLNSATLSSGTSAIGKSAFMGCITLDSMTFPTSIKTIDEDAFKGSAIIDVELQQCSALSTIGKWAFADNKGLKSVKLPASIESIGDGAFFYSTNLQSISLPSGVTTISDFLLTGCTSINPETVLKSNIKKIGKYAFRDWDQMVKLTLPATINFIDDNAFENCSGLNVVIAKAINAPELGEDVFKGIKQSSTKLYVPTESEKIYKNALQWREFEVIACTSNVENPAIDNTLKVYFQGTTLNIESQMDIKLVRLFDINGIQLTNSNPDNTSAQINTEIYFAKNYILTVELSDGKIQHFKLARK